MAPLCLPTSLEVSCHREVTPPQHSVSSSIVTSFQSEEARKVCHLGYTPKKEPPNTEMFEGKNRAIFGNTPRAER